MESLNAAQSVLRALGGIVESRFEMFTLEAAIEKRKVALLLGAALLSAGFTLLAFTFAGILLILLAPVGYSAHVACAWMLLNALMAAICAGVIFILLRRGVGPFEHTREELRKDIACLGTGVKLDE